MMTKNRNTGEKRRCLTWIARVVGFLLIALFLVWLLFPLLTASPNWEAPSQWKDSSLGLSDTSAVILLAIGLGLVLFSHLLERARKLELWGIVLDLSEAVEEVQITQLIGEVVTGKDTQASKFYWIDREGVKHLLHDAETALVYATQRGIIGVNEECLARIKTGDELPEISKDDFRYIGGKDGGKHFFVVTARKAFWITSLAYLYKYGVDDLDDIKEISSEEFREYEVVR